MKNETNQIAREDRSWEKVIMKYNRPDLLKSLWQIFNSLVPYIGIWYLMVVSLQYSYWITLLLALPASGLLIRLFIIFHDCGHGSFFKSQKANKFVGKLLGILAFTPFNKWHQQHKIHHATSGNLDKRGIGDVWTMTVEEFMKASKWQRLLYRIFRNPYFMFTLAPVYVIFIQNRTTRKSMNRQERLNVYFTNLMVLLLSVSVSLLIGFKAFLLIQMPILVIGHIIGLWLFYIQHQFDDVEWERTEKWDYKTAAVTGSSFLKLPVVLQWFTGNIGFHHVHHLSSRIPNYYLARCHYENELFRDIKPVVLLSTFKALKLSLWDETTRQMITFRRLANSLKLHRQNALISY